MSDYLCGGEHYPYRECEECREWNEYFATIDNKKKKTEGKKDGTSGTDSHKGTSQ